MPNRSQKEIAFATYLLHALGQIRLAEPSRLAATAVLATLDEGWRHAMFDQRIGLPGRQILMFEYDGGFYHTPERVPRDMAKSLEALLADPSALVVRARVNAAPLRVDHVRCVIVPLATEDTYRGVQAVAAELAHHVDESLRGPLREYRLSKLERDLLGDIAYEVAKLDDARYNFEVTCMEAVFGKPVTLRMSDVHGFRSLLSLGGATDKLQTLCTTFALSPNQLVKFMCDGVASAHATDAPAFMAHLATLATDFGIRGKELVKFMCGGVASALKRDARGFIDTLCLIRDALGLTSTQMTALMGNSVASRLGRGNGAFEVALCEFRQIFATTDAFVGAMSDSIACRLGRPGFCEAYAAQRLGPRLSRKRKVDFLSDFDRLDAKRPHPIEK